MRLKRPKKSRRAAREDVERALKILEDEHGVPLACFKCTEKAIGMDECITCEKLGKSHRVLSCAQHREQGLTAVKKHALVRHPANLLRVVAAGLRGEKI